MDTGHATPTGLPSQAFSPPAPPSAAAAATAAAGAQAAGSDLSGSDAVLAAIDSSAYDTTQACGSSKRQPLQESTGNVQHHLNPIHHNHYHQQLDFPPSSSHQHYPQGQYVLSCTRSCTPIMPSTLGGSITAPLPTAPFLPTASSLHLRRYEHELLRQKRTRNRNLNPIYEKAQFQAYRERHKDRDAKVWQDELEHPFLDALLIIPFMGRRKFYMSGKPHGRNMIICEYVWLRWCATQPPGTDLVKVRDEHLPDKDKLPERHPDKYHPMFRKRKQGSSHIQVLKGYFKHSWAYHFFFSKGKEEGSKHPKRQPAPNPNRWYKENTDQRSFKSNPVLCALEKQQLPAERPNYEYFRQLLAMDSRTQVQPSTCWIYIANKHLVDKPSSLWDPKIEDKGKYGIALDIKTSPHMQYESKGTRHAAMGMKYPKEGEYSEDVKHPDAFSPATSANTNANGNGSSNCIGNGNKGNGNGTNTYINTYHTKKGLLFREDFPHRYAFNNPPSSDSDAGNNNSPWLEREREVRGISQTLLHEYTFDLKQTESSCVREVLDEWKEDHPELYNRLQGVIKAHNLETIHEKPQSQMCDLIHVDVTLDVHRVPCLPEGTNLEWLIMIDVAQPSLAGHEWNVRTWLERPLELARSTSEGRRGRRMMITQEDGIMRNKLTHVRGCGVENPHCDCQARQGSNTWLLPIPVRTWAESIEMCAQFPRYLLPKKAGTSRTRKEDEIPESETVTQMDLMRATAMYQELWSKAPMMPGSLEEPQWTRRAIILWTFNTTDFFDVKKEIRHTPAGTSWRWLSAIDPLSVSHQERAILPGNVDSDSSPAETYQPLLTSQMSGNLWGLTSGGVHSAPASMPVSPLAPYGPSPVHGHGSFTDGLVTPPASATLPSTFVLEGIPGVMHSNNFSSYLPVTSMDSKTTFVTGDGFNTGYLQDPGHGSFYEEADDNESDTSLTMQGEPADLSSYESHAWSNLNNSAHAANGAVGLDWDTHGLQSLSMVAEELANQGGELKTSSMHRGYETYDDNSFEQMEREYRSRFDRARRVPLNDDARSSAAEYRSNEGRQNEVVSDVSHGYGQQVNAATSLGQYTAEWDVALSQHYQHRNVGLAFGNETRAVSDTNGSINSPAPTLNRKRQREDDDEGQSGRYPLVSMPSYVQRSDGRYAPTAVVDRQESQGWS